MNNQTPAIGAIGAVLGYIGAEGASPAIFERLLWPQRSYAGFTYQPKEVLKLALLGPSGGPTYKAALQVLDNAYLFGLLRGTGLGHMLGTAFYPQSMSTYRMCGSGKESPARNCIWERVVGLLPAQARSAAPEKGEESGVVSAVPTRTQVGVHHITLSVEACENGSPSLLGVDTDASRTSPRIWIGMVVSEILGIVFTVLTAAVWQSGVAVLFICPLLIKVLSAVASLDREALELRKADVQGPHQDIEIRMPLENGAFLLLSGPPSLLLQFVRHYGHPVRNRSREMVQLIAVIASACLFPLGVVLSVTIMSENVQYVWISYQMYLVLTMYISRYMSQSLWTSTEEMIARKMSSEPRSTYLWKDREACLRVRATLETTLHDRLADARVHFQKLTTRSSTSCMAPSVDGMVEKPSQ